MTDMTTSSGAPEDKSWDDFDRELQEQTKAWTEKLKSEDRRIGNKPKESGSGVAWQVVGALKPKHLARFVVESYASVKDQGDKAVGDPLYRWMTIRQKQADRKTAGNSRGALRFLTASYASELLMKKAVMESLRERLGDLAGLELINDTGVPWEHSKITSTIENTRACVEAAHQLDGLKEGNDKDDPSDAEKLAFTRYEARALAMIQEIVDTVDDVSAACKGTLEYGAIKAIITSPDNKGKYDGYYRSAQKAAKVTETVIEVVDSTADETIGRIPEAHSKAGHLATTIGISILGVLNATFNKLLEDFALDADIESFKDKYGSSAVYEMLKPLDIANRLKDERIETITLALKYFDPEIAAVNAFVPVAKSLWQLFTTQLLRFIKDWEERRIELAQRIQDAIDTGKLPPPEKGQWSLGDAWKEVKKLPLEEAKDYAEVGVEQIKEQVTELFKENMSPSALWDGVKEEFKEGPKKINIDQLIITLVNPLLKKVIDVVVKALPVDPAQRVSAEDLGGYVSSITDTVVIFVEIAKGERQAPNPDPPKLVRDYGPLPYSGRAVLRVLSEQREDEQGHPCWVAEVALQDDQTLVGILTKLPDSDGGGFAPLGGDDISKGDKERFPQISKPGAIEEVSKIPTEDKHGREIRDVLLDTLVHEPGQFEAWTCRVRIGDMWGLLDVRHNDFTPIEPDPSAFASWNNRIVYGREDEKAEMHIGYRERAAGMKSIKDSPVIRGEWYRPLRNEQYYLFVGDDGKREWARGIDRVGNGPDASYRISSMLGESKQVRHTPLTGEQLYEVVMGA